MSSMSGSCSIISSRSRCRTTSACRWVAITRALKDYVFHFGAAQMLDTLLAQDPGNRVGNIALPQPFGPTRQLCHHR